jgi:hypothetical protein
VRARYRNGRTRINNRAEYRIYPSHLNIMQGEYNFRRGLVLDRGRDLYHVSRNFYGSLTILLSFVITRLDLARYQRVCEIFSTDGKVNYCRWPFGRIYKRIDIQRSLWTQTLMDGRPKKRKAKDDGHQP